MNLNTRQVLQLKVCNICGKRKHSLWALKTNCTLKNNASNYTLGPPWYDYQRRGALRYINKILLRIILILLKQQQQQEVFSIYWKNDNQQFVSLPVISYPGHFVPTLVILYLHFGHFVPSNNHFVPRPFRTHFGHFVPRSTGYEMTIWSFRWMD